VDLALADVYFSADGSLRPANVRGIDSESDETVAGIRARGVPGAFGVEKELVVEKERRR
jgi:hypothetical protein